MDNLCCMSPEAVTILATSIAVELAKDKTPQEILAIRNIMNQVTQSLYTLYSQQIFLQSNCNVKQTTKLTQDEKNDTKNIKI